MGILRLLLAISVVIAHSKSIFGFNLVGGEIAVKSFYIISGFYMSLILNEKYINKNNSYQLFITNRFLRLFPVYWVVLLITVLGSLSVYFLSHGLVCGNLAPYLKSFHLLNPFSFLFLVFTNIFIFFQDIVYFLGLNPSNGNLYFTSNFQLTNPKLFPFLPIPQAWTIAVELSFYLLAPFLLRRNWKVIVSLIILSLGLRVILYSHGLNHDPWTYRFFPTELLFFLLGNISYRIYRKLATLKLPALPLDFGILFILGFVLFFDRLQFTGVLYFYFLCFFILLPFIFYRTKQWKLDGYLGELSYPVYISHWLMLIIINFLIKNHGYAQFGLIATISTIMFSVVLNELVCKKVELIRQNRLNKML